jgi:hypothetical protein
MRPLRNCGTWVKGGGDHFDRRTRDGAVANVTCNSMRDHAPDVG